MNCIDDVKKSQNIQMKSKESGGLFLKIKILQNGRDNLK